MVADPLSPDAPHPPHPGLVPVAGPPRVLRALWARARFDTPDQLGAALARLDPYVQRPTVRRALLQVVYRPETLSAAAAAHHAAFAARHPRVSTYLPFCLPGSPNHATLGAFATPHACHRCLFYEGRACQGLGDDPRPWIGLTGGPALHALDRPLHAFRRADFGGKDPVTYWLPTRHHVATIGAAVRAVGGRLWDLGGGNGFVAGLLAADEGLDVTLVDRGPAYPAPAGVRRVQADVRDPIDAPPPDALLVSWPPTGDGFRDVIERLAPKVLVFAFDAEGFCGRRPGYVGVIASSAGLAWSAFPEADFRALPGLPVRRRWRVACYNDLRQGSSARTGVLQIRARSPLPPVGPVDRYPWERAD